MGPLFVFTFFAAQGTFGATIIENTAKAAYSIASLPATSYSNKVSTTVRTPAVLEYLKYAPLSASAEAVNVSTTKYIDSTGSHVAMSNPVPTGSTSALDLSSPLPLIEAAVYHEGEPIFLRLTDYDRNIDPAAAETIELTIAIKENGEKEILVLTETGPDMGSFVGYIQSNAAGTVDDYDGKFSVFEDARILATYRDDLDGDITYEATALVDPYGVVFDTSSGAPINGVTVTLMDLGESGNSTPKLANVYGDDGVSDYPTTVTTGGLATDGSGAVYASPPGGYRFPYIEPGRWYRLDIVLPAGFKPSTLTYEELNNIKDGSGNSFAIIEPGSKGEPFYMNPGPPLNIDIPADTIQTSLYVTKAAAKPSVSIGDFLQYRITVENTAVFDVNSVLLEDRLPLGFRYRKGSTKINGTSAADPSISTDGRTLVFSIGTSVAGSSGDITYVAEVAAGAKVGKATNYAEATGTGGAASNTARAEVLVKEDLLGSRAIIMGRVFPGCEDHPSPQSSPHEGRGGLKDDGVAGVRIYLEDGTYVVTDKNGMYHFEGLKPGTHVVQLDLVTIPEEYELVSCEENSRFAGTPYSQFVDLQGGSMWRADFYLLRKPREEPVVVELKGSATIELSSVLAGAYSDTPLSDDSMGRQNVGYSVAVHVGNVPLKNLRLTIMLPDGFSYISGSSHLGETELPDPEIMEGVLTYRLGDVEDNWSGNVRFSAVLPVEGKEGELLTRAILTFDSTDSKNMRTPLAENMLIRTTGEERKTEPDITLHPHFDVIKAELKKEDTDILDGIISELKKVKVIEIHVTGHTDSTRIAPRSRHIFADNYALSRARAESVGRYLGEGLGLSPAQITIEGKGPDVPVSSNKTEEGRAINRRVELRISALKSIQWSEIGINKDNSGMKQVDITVIKTEGKPVVAGNEDMAMGNERVMPEFDNAWLNAAKPGLGWVWPYEGFNPSIPSLKIAVKYDPRKGFKLHANGKEVDAFNLENVTKRSDGQVAIGFWLGISLREGDNFIEAVEYNEGGAENHRIRRIIHYSGPPVKAEVVNEKSRLLADGKTPPVIAFRLTDKDGYPAREGMLGEYIVLPPHLSFKKMEELQASPIAAISDGVLKYMVDDGGIVLVELQPTTKSGEAAVRFKFGRGDQEVKAWLAPGERDWILVGLAEGTAGYNTVSGNMESLGDSGADDKYYDDGRIAFFAKGMIKGKWLLTAAYDSEKKGIRNNDSLHGIIDPDKYYTLYGDATQQGYEAASARSLYLKIERDKFYAIFGDFDTGLTVTELSRYSRNLNGFKSEMKGDKFDFNVFVSDTNQAFVKDEIRGDGTSGLYRLSKKNIVINSETITLETRDRFRSEVVISSQQLSRHIDYSIDYDAGTLYFKTPIYNRDENFNPIYIVVSYESFDPSDISYNYGGRGAVRMLDDKVEMGATLIHEGRIGGEGNLTGIDARIKIDDKTTARTELAQTNTDFNNNPLNGNAYLAEVTRRSEKLEGKAYIREQEGDFGLGQQNGSESGTRKLGIGGTYRLDEQVSFGTEVYRQYNLSTDAVRDMAEVQARFSEKQYELHGGLRHAEDSLGDGSVNRSEQLTAGGSVRALNDKLVFRLDHDQSLIRSNVNADFPTRTTMGVDYKLSDTASLIFAQEFTHGETEDTETTRIGLKTSPWKGGQITSTLEQQYTENGARVFAVNGLKQTWQVTKKWSMDAGLDRSETLAHPGRSNFNLNTSASSGGTDFTSVSLGAAYKEDKWSWTGRIEKRDSEAEEKVGIFTGAYGEVRGGIGLAAALQAFRTESSSGAEKNSGNLRFSLAHRPLKSRWIILDRLDYMFDEQKGTGFDFDNWRIINNLNANWKMDRRTQLSLQYGAKYVNETIGGMDYIGFTDLSGIEARYDITKKWDIGLRGNLLHSWEVGQYKYGYGPSVGYNLVKNMWLSMGYNLEGFTDRDFSRADFTAEGPYVKFRMKFDKETVKDAVKWFSGQ